MDHAWMQGSVVPSMRLLQALPTIPAWPTLGCNEHRSQAVNSKSGQEFHSGGPAQVSSHSLGVHQGGVEGRGKNWGKRTERDTWSGCNWLGNEFWTSSGKLHKQDDASPKASKDDREPFFFPRFSFPPQGKTVEGGSEWWAQHLSWTGMHGKYAEDCPRTIWVGEPVVQGFFVANHGNSKPGGTKWWCEAGGANLNDGSVAGYDGVN